MLANCGHNEYGGITGGSPGDQSKTEYYVRSWYNGSWNGVLRHSNRNVGIQIAQIARDLAKNDNIGYDQNRRHTYYQRLRSANWNPSSIRTKCDADCSSSTCANVIAAGHKLNNSALTSISPHCTTSTIRAALTSVGFSWLTASRYRTSDAYLPPGDILLHTGHHVTINLDSGSKSGSNINVSSGGGSVANAFVPRLTAPSTSDKNWINVAYGGKNRCIVCGSNGSVLPNCFSGDTKIITDEGEIELGAHAGGLYRILTIDGTYRWAAIGYFGVQDMYKVHLSNGNSYTCTLNHRWVIYRDNKNYEIIKTKDLKPGMKIKSIYQKNFVYVIDVRYTRNNDLAFCPVEPHTHTCVLAGGEITGQCTGYAWGRFMELIGEEPDLSTGNAGLWYKNTRDGYSRGRTPQLGAVACWSRPGAAGHVAIVESIGTTGTVTFSNSGYNSKRFFITSGTAPNYTSWQGYEFQGFIYNPNDYSVGGGGNLYDTLNDQDDAIMREVLYMSGTRPTTIKTNIRLSVINYTTALNSFFAGMINTGGSGSGSSVDASKLTGNYKIIFEFLVGKGLNARPHAGYAQILRENLMEILFAVSSDGYGSIGICQWTFGRKTAMIAYVGNDWRTDLTGQLNYLWRELNGSYKNSVLNPIKKVPNNVTGAKSAADIFVRKFEVPANVNVRSRERQKWAEQFWNQLAIQQTI